MTTVYVVGEFSGTEGWEVAGVFSTEAKAAACAAKEFWWEVREFELDLDDWTEQWVAATNLWARPKTWSYMRREKDIRVGAFRVTPKTQRGMGRTKEEAEENLRRAINGLATEEAPEL